MPLQRLNLNIHSLTTQAIQNRHHRRPFTFPYLSVAMLITLKINTHFHSPAIILALHSPQLTDLCSLTRTIAPRSRVTA
jgi:hypothetical protein